MNRSDWSPLEEEVRRRLKEYFGDEGSAVPAGGDSAAPGGDADAGTAPPRFILAVSGGPDSMALMYAFHRLGIGAVVVHINYNKRGAESDQDAELVEELAFEWGFDCHSLSVDPAEAEGENFQQWARDLRYEAFRSLRREYECDGIALAHHEDDQAETVLQKLFRGAGLVSWQGMEVWDGELFRPLLHLAREQVMAYLEEHSIPWRTDVSNLGTEYARNFLRHEWLPELERHFPGWKKNILRAGDQAKLFETALDWIDGRVSGPEGGLKRDELLSLEPALAKALLLYKVRRAVPGISVSRENLNELDKLGSLQTGKAIQLAEKMEVMRDRDLFKIVLDTGEQPVDLPLRRDRLRERPVSFDGLRFALEPLGDPAYGRNLYLDADAIDWPLTLRRWREGDRFQPLGMEGTQKVSDHLTNRKVDASLRDRALVLESFDQIIKAVIFPPSEQRVPPGTVSESVRCHDGTKICLVVVPNAD